MNDGEVKIGLEIHQRLNTGKLFCRCPSASNGEVKNILKRRLHIVKSELGEEDIAAQVEELKSKEFTYYIYDNSCLVECDEEPPHPMNNTALHVCLAVAQHLNMDIVDQIFVMRKTVIDGSNTSGFQRTAIIGLGGRIASSKGDVGVQTLCIEEESSSIIGKREEGKFGLDRLGIPLIEIATAPDIKDGEHAREVAKSIGMMLRMTGKSARGIGTIRQDLNISIPGGARVEIKGVQELDDIPKIVDNEILRQKQLLQIINKLPNKAPSVKDIEYIDVTDEFANGKKWIVKMIEKGAKVIAVKLPAMKGLLGIELCEGRRYGSELSDYAKSYGFGGLMHGDEDFEKYGVSRRDIEKRLKLGRNDSYAILIGAFDSRMKLAFNALVERAYLKRIPEETRRVAKGGITQYMRPMATGARMYPETDIKPILVDKSLILESKKYAPRDPAQVLKEIEKDTNKDLAVQLIRSPFLGTYYSAIKRGIPAKTAAVMLVNTLKSISRDGLDIQNIDEDQILEALEQYRDKKITKKGIEEVLRRLCAKEGNVAQIIKEHSLERICGDKLAKIGKKFNWDIKKIMSMHRMNIDAEELMALRKKHAQKG